VILLQFPPLVKARCEEMDLVLFHVIPEKAGIQYFHDVMTDWTPVFTGVTAKIQFFHFRELRRDL
jgi:hypothetical protein